MTGAPQLSQAEVEALKARLGPPVPSDVLPHSIFCRGHDRHTGKRCRRLIAKVEHGIPVVRHHKLEVGGDLGWVKCPDCGTVRHFGGGVPEELLGAVPIPTRVLGLTG